MITDEQIELIIQRLLYRMQQANTEILMNIGSSVKKFKELTPTKARQLAQTLKYGGNYEKMIREVAKYADLSVKEVKEIFEEYARQDQAFYEQFYNYRNIPFVRYDENMQLKMQTEALANIAQSDINFFTRDKVLGYSIRDAEGNVQFSGLKETYNRVIDEALMNVSQGKEGFDAAMSRLLREIGGSGLKTLDYTTTYIDKNGIERHRSVDLQSTIRTYILDGLKKLHNENQKIFGKEFGADGVEVTVHLNPAPDHEEVQGHQFSNVEFDKFQNDIDCVDYKGKEYPAEFEGHDRRSISQYNCYHKIYSIVLGVSQPEYTDEQLQQIIDENRKGFELDGKHYTNYEGTQLQRKIEREVRKQKDLQILYRSSGDDTNAQKAQKKINQLAQKYDELSKASGLQTEKDRMKVSGYHKIKVQDEEVKTPKTTKKIDYNVWKNDTIYLSKDRTNLRKDALIELINEKEKEVLEDKKILDERNIDVNDSSRNATHYRANLSTLNKYKNELENYKDLGEKQITLNSLEDCQELLSYNNIKMDIKTFKDCDFNVVKENTKALYDLSNKYPKIAHELSKYGIVFNVENLDETTLAKASHFDLTLNRKYYKDYKKLVDTEYNSILFHTLTAVKSSYLDKAAITHEFGHIISYKMQQMYVNEIGKYINFEKWSKMLLDDFMEYSSKKLNISKEKLFYLNVSDYGKSHPAEAFAELFRSLNGGISNKLSDALGEYLEERLNDNNRKTLFFK